MLCSSLNVDGLLTSPKKVFATKKIANQFLFGLYIFCIFKKKNQIQKNALKTTSLAVLVP